MGRREERLRHGEHGVDVLRRGVAALHPRLPAPQQIGAPFPIWPPSSLGEEASSYGRASSAMSAKVPTQWSAIHAPVPT